MIQRFHFDLTNGKRLIRDHEGVDASGPDEAITEAQVALDELRNNDWITMPGAGWRLLIRDESGMTLRSMPLTDVSVHYLERVPLRRASYR